MRIKTVIVLSLLLSACSSATPKMVRVTAPPMPVIDPHVEPIPTPIGTALQKDPGQIDPIGLVIVEARVHFEHGNDLYNQGFLKRAKQQFDDAIDLLLDSSTQHPNNPRLERETTDLVAKVHSLELAAFRDGDGFTDQTQEHAAIDDLEHITTFPSPIDPKLKKEVEEEVAEVGHDLPIEINDRVLGFLDYYQNGRGRTFIELGLERVGKYQTMIEQILKEEGVPQDLIYLCQAESEFVPRAVSRAQAKGMWQFISSRGKEYGLKQNWWIDERSDPEKSTRAAARHLKDLYTQFGDWYLAMAAYNAGPMRIQRAMDKTGATDFWGLAEKKALPKETMNYVPTILALSIIGKNPDKYGFTVVPAPPLETERVMVDKATDLRVIAEAIHVPVEDLRDLNPHVLRSTTPPGDPEFELILPKGYADSFRDQIASLPDAKRVLFRYHTVQRNETLSTVAKKYGTSTTELAEANSISSKKPLRVGQELMIPMSGAGPAQTASVTKVKATTTTAGARTTTATSYTVRSGDTLAKIATKYGVTTAQLKDWNKMPSARLTVGKKLIVAHAAVAKPIIHKVQAGETLVKIASTYKTTVEAIMSWNKKNDLSVLHPGDQITIYLGGRP